jgi:hypothetical protein
MKKTIRCFSYAAIGVALLLVGVQTAGAHRDPKDSTATGIALSITAFRADGVTPAFPNEVITQWETIIYQAKLSWAGESPGGKINAAFSGGTIVITTPDGVPHDVTGGTGAVPCVGGTYNGPDPILDQCSGAPTSYTSQQVSFTANVADCAATPFLEASVSYEGGTLHWGGGDPAVAASNLGPASASVLLKVPVVCLDIAVIIQLIQMPLR